MKYDRASIGIAVWLVCAVGALICFWIKRNWHVLTSLLSGRQTMFVTVHDLTAELHQPADPRGISYYTYTAAFRTEKGQIFALEVSEQAYLRLDKGAQGRLTFQGRWFRSFVKGTKETLPPIRQTALQRLADALNERRYKAACRNRVQHEPDRPMRLDLLENKRVQPVDKPNGVLTHELDE